jgi:Na+/H+ antiporter NhaD/arsenite permease-like protein
VIAVAYINPGTLDIIRDHPNLSYLRELVITIMAILSSKFTNQHIRHVNHFNWEPIEEEAYLFLGIFVTMIPCLLYLEQNAANLGVTMPMHYYYASGALSSFLDNTPTAVTFYSLARGVVEASPTILFGRDVVGGIPDVFMRGICLGAVFFGAMTYIGNGPNFMVKSIAEHRNIIMPHFFAYMIKFSLIILLPLFILTQIIFVK